MNNISLPLSLDFIYLASPEFLFKFNLKIVFWWKRANNFFPTVLWGISSNGAQQKSYSYDFGHSFGIQQLELE